MPGHYHQAGTGTQNQDNIMGDRPSVRISDTAYKHNHGNAMSDLMGGGTSRAGSSSGGGTTRRPDSSCSSSWRGMHNNNQQRGVRGMAGSQHSPGHKEGGMDSSRSSSSMKPPKLDMQRVVASRERPAKSQSPLQCPRSHAGSPEPDSPVKSPAEKIKESRLKAPKSTSRSRAGGAPPPTAHSKAAKTKSKGSKQGSKQGSKPPQAPGNQSRGAAAEVMGGTGIIPGSINEGAVTNRGTMTKSKSSGVVVHRPQISAEPIALHKPATPASRPPPVTIVASVGQAQGNGIPGLDAVAWKCS